MDDIISNKKKSVKEKQDDIVVIICIVEKWTWKLEFTMQRLLTTSL